MKAILTNYRYYLLVVLCAIALVGIMIVPAEKLPTVTWCYVLVSSKIIAFLAVYISARLIKRWETRGSIPELIKAVENY